MNKKIAIAVTCSFLLSSSLFAQTYQVTWGDETKMKKSTVDMHLIHADNSGVYFLEGETRLKSYFVIGASFKTAYKLIKFDKNYNKLYEKDYGKDLKDVSFNSIQPLKNQLYVFVNHYNKKENNYRIFGAMIDSNTGALTGELQEIGSWTFESDKDDVDYIVKPTPDSSGWMMVTNIIGDKKSYNNMYVTILDNKLNKKQNILLKLKGDPAAFSLEDVIPLADRKFLVLTKQFEMVEGKRKKMKPVFKNYVLAKYDEKGFKEAALNFDAQDKYTIGGKLITLHNGEVLLAGFYSNNPDKKQLNGVYICKIDALKGTVAQASIKEISKDMISDAPDSTLANGDENANDKESKKRKEEDDDPIFSNSYQIRSVMVSPNDQSIWITAESYKLVHKQYSYTHYNSITKTSEWVNVSDYIFTNSDLLVINSMVNGDINTIYNIPKKQVEAIYNHHSGYGFSLSYDMGGIFASGGGMPFYSSVATLMYGNKLIILFNDNAANADVKDQNDSKHIKGVYNTFKKTQLYAISLDITNGTITRRSVLTNDDNIAMPRFAYVSGNEIYLPSSKKKALAKTDMRMGKITVQ